MPADGELLFTGDLLFAASPGIAGATGWSQETLIHSLGAVETLITKEGIQLVCSGHGRVIPAADALRVLSAVRADARSLANIAEMEPDRAARTAAFAGDCMEQVNEIFTIMSGRLQYVSFILDELGESGIADRSSTLIRGDVIDELLEAFHNFAEEQRKGLDVPIHRVLKAGQVIAKLERTFNRDELPAIIDPSLVRRAGRLLSDYTTMLRGFTPPSECSDCDLNTLTESVVTGLTVPPFTDDEVLSSADDDAAFYRILLARIGTPPLLADVEVTVLSEADPLQVCIDREHFTDLLTYILEDLVGTGADRIEISTRHTGRNAIVTVAGNGPSSGTVKGTPYLAIPAGARGTYRRIPDIPRVWKGNISSSSSLRPFERYFLYHEPGGINRFFSSLPYWLLPVFRQVNEIIRICRGQSSIGKSGAEFTKNYIKICRKRRFIREHLSRRSLQALLS